MNDAPLVTLSEASDITGVPVGTLYSWVSRYQLIPASVPFPGRKLYRLDEIRRLAETASRRRRTS